MTYQLKFKTYLDDLSKRKPSPGGGSVVCLGFCLGISLIEKSAQYSIVLKPKNSSQSAINKRLKAQLTKLAILRKKISPYIDRDSYLFNKIISEKGKKRTQFIKESEKLIVDVAKSSQKVKVLVKGIKTDIKKNIVSDLNIGLELIRVAFLGCVLNLEANQQMFGSKNKHLIDFKRSLRVWR